MAKNLVIVESPAKAKTISRFLGKDYTVLASMGHIRDLPKSKMGIDTEGNFEPIYEIPADKKKIIKELKSKLTADTVLYIATDEDREGEAIGWHLTKALKADEKKTKRIVFHEITEGAIKDALKNPRKIDMDLVDAQQARRILDRIVGYELSPVLWKKIRYGLSAGRVQSVVVRLIVEREREIEAFKPEEYWSLVAYFAKQKDKKEFSSLLAKYKGKKIEVKDGKKAEEILTAVKDADFIVKDVTEKDTKRQPSPPFITSTLQQEASHKLNFSVKKTMMLAQQLYEGVKVKGGETGLITYMRTDSVNLSNVALAQAREVITQEYGKEYALTKPRFYKSKKGAQEAHEAIRPTDLSLLPSEAKAHLSNDQYRLYDLIWKRTIACQMAEALLTQTGIDIDAQGTGYEFRANGQVVKFPGFMKAYKAFSDEEEDEEGILPELKVGEELDTKGFDSKQHFTKPPARYNEASLVKKLESEGIGRPSTYAPTISTVQTRGYVKKEGRVLYPTDLGEIVNDMLVKHFYGVVDYKFTAEMEEQLDKIAEGDKGWVPILKEFYNGFHKLILEKSETLKKEDLIEQNVKEKCEECGKPMVIKFGRFGKFLSCSGYPDCKNAKPLGDAPERKIDPETEKKFKDKKCPKCGKPMVVKVGRYGEFLGCSDYPKCKGIESIAKYAKVDCPKCGAKLIERHARKSGKKFWGCSAFPKCKFATWDEPLEKCKCGGVIVMKKDKKVCMECKEESK